MTPEQIRELIGHLQRVLEEKTRGGDRSRGGSDDEVLRRLDRLSKEIEEIRRSIKR
jgi:hypothetical protein